MAGTGGFHFGKTIAPVRFIVFAVLLAIGCGVAIPAIGWSRGTMAGFDVAGAVFLVSLLPLLHETDADQMRRRARANDANRVFLLALTGLVTAVVLVAVGSEVSDRASLATTALVLGTLVLAWLFSNTIYALHYAHLFYLEEDGRDAGGLDVPKTEEPDYWDFIYFSFTLGMTFQTSDVEVTTRHLRRVVIGHCLVAFVFNLGVIAFTINVLGGG